MLLQQPSVSVLWVARRLLPTTVSWLCVKAKILRLQNILAVSSVFVVRVKKPTNEAATTYSVAAFNVDPAKLFIQKQKNI